MILQILFWIAFIIWVALTIWNSFTPPLPGPHMSNLRLWAERIAAFAAVFFLGLRVFAIAAAAVPG